MAREQERAADEQLQRERWELLAHINALSDKPLIALSFVWLILLIVDFTVGLNRPLQITSYVIWALFVLDFAIEIIIAPHKLDYLRSNWLTALALVLPALRVLRVFRALRVLRLARATRSVSFVRLLTSLNRGMRAVRRTLGSYGVGYVVALTVIVTFAGAAGMYLFENPVAENGTGLDSYSEAIWWTAMIMTTMGSEYWPKTGEGRVLGWLLSLYAFAVFGYITATIASYFLGQKPAAALVEDGSGEAGGADAVALRAEIAALTSQVEALRAALEERSPAPIPGRDPGLPPR